MLKGAKVMVEMFSRLMMMTRQKALEAVREGATARPSGQMAINTLHNLHHEAPWRNRSLGKCKFPILVTQPTVLE